MRQNMQLHLLLPQGPLMEAFQVVLLLKCKGEADLCAICDVHKKREKPAYIYIILMPRACVLKCTSVLCCLNPVHQS